MHNKVVVFTQTCTTRGNNYTDVYNKVVVITQGVIFKTNNTRAQQGKIITQTCTTRGNNLQ